jgi:microcompartment protein CcmK/EutM
LTDTSVCAGKIYSHKNVDKIEYYTGYVKLLLLASVKGNGDKSKCIATDQVGSNHNDSALYLGERGEWFEFLS